MNLHLRFFCPFDEYYEFLKILRMIMIGWHHDGPGKTVTREDRCIVDFLSFCSKMVEGSGAVSGRPGKEISVDFECTANEYDAAVFILEHSAIYHSQLPGNNNENAETAILSALIVKRLRRSPVLPDLEILMETETGIFLKDLDGGNVSIADSAELVCLIFADSKRIFYENTGKQWAELVHENGVFLRFASISDDEINRIKANFL
jgi:hypothetical protein